ncbi:cytochrome b/b6 domain-containing protein [Leifsonia sp. H3M29-4]|nr:cytochrome b/b6 domain-containing protein [Salinibacterium metalliresistens]MDF1479321.1 cytochrome b/b6 domain-containing protein [Salinibacterium metalliresistens]
MVALLWLGPIAIVFAAAAVLLANILRDVPAVQDFMTTYPGEYHLPEGAPVGFPAWLAWQHFLNVFFLLLIVRTGWQVRTTTRPPAYWTRNNAGPIKTKYPPTKISLSLWLHLSLDVLWVANGVLFVVLLFVSGQWMRIIPTSWEVFPNAVSVAIQYASLNWPTENGWVNYNSLQQLAYFATVFIAAPLAIVSGFRMSPLWNQRFAKLSKVYPVTVARAIHLPVMIYFVLFVIAHVALVFATGALRNLNHMYGGQDAVNWVGFWIFAGSVVLMIAVWLLARPLFLLPIASLTGNVTKR